MNWWEIVEKVLLIVGPLLVVWLGANINTVIKELKEFIAKLRAAYADGNVTKDELPEIISEALDVLVAALPFFIGKKLKQAAAGLKWREN